MSNAMKKLAEHSFNALFEATAKHRQQTKKEMFPVVVMFDYEGEMTSLDLSNLGKADAAYVHRASILPENIVVSVFICEAFTAMAKAEDADTVEKLKSLASNGKLKEYEGTEECIIFNVLTKDEQGFASCIIHKSGDDCIVEKGKLQWLDEGTGKLEGVMIRR
jgi:hypothetical protein